MRVGARAIVRVDDVLEEGRFIQQWKTQRQTWKLRSMDTDTLVSASSLQRRKGRVKVRVRVRVRIRVRVRVRVRARARVTLSRGSV